MIFDCSQYHRSSELILGFVGSGSSGWRRCEGRGLLVELIWGFLLLLVVHAYSCRLKLGENEGGLVGEGEEDEKKEVSLGLV
ncbi:hypothetical protein KY285_003804 [Solanum tuberosum]|nr:hypothetical protein KY285_003804 [Solanum tuberosum]